MPTPLGAQVASTLADCGARGAEADGNSGAIRALTHPDGGLRLLHRRVKPEGAVHEVDVVVDGLGDASDAEPQVLVSRGRVQLLRAAVGPVAADDVQLVHAVAMQPGKDPTAVEPPARGAQHRPSLVMDPLHRCGGEQDGFLLGRHALISIADAEHGVDSVELVQRINQLADDVVDPRAQAAAGYDRGPYLAWVPVDVRAGAGPDVCDGFGRLLNATNDVGEDVVRLVCRGLGGGMEVHVASVGSQLVIRPASSEGAASGRRRTLEVAVGDMLPQRL